MKRPFRILATGLLAAIFAGAPAAASPLTDRLLAMSDAGNAEATYDLGLAYGEGHEGLPRDSARAIELFRRAAAAGDPIAAYLLSLYYEEGSHGFTRDLTEMARLQLIAAEAGLQIAQFRVAERAEAAGDLDTAIRWYEAAAHQGDREALGRLFAIHGPGGARPDRVLAHVYLEIVWPAMSRELAQYRVVSGRGPTPLDMARRQRRGFAEGVPERDRARARQMIRDWSITQTPATVRGAAGWDAVQRLVPPTP
jgi:TPR repeat protein